MRPKSSRPDKHASSHASNQNHQVRIIAGQWRRHLLPVLMHEGLRPSSDRVRETVFNWLNHLWGGQFAEKYILDMFAGSGAFGLECISRGARHVTLLDNHLPAVKAIQSTLNHWQQQDNSIQDARVECVDTMIALPKLNDAKIQFDLIILDPPFGQNWLDKIMTLVLPLCHANTLIYVETEKQAETAPLLLEHFELLREGLTQQVRYGLWRRAEHP